MTKIAEELLFAELALAACGAAIDEDAEAESWRLLAVLRRTLKVSTVVIACANANRVLFQCEREDGKIWPLVCSQDIRADDRVRPGHVATLQHCLRSYIGAALRFGSQRRTLILCSNKPRVFSPSDFLLVAQVCQAIEARHAARRHLFLGQVADCLFHCSTLLDGVKGSVHCAARALRELREREKAAPPTQRRALVRGLANCVADVDLSLARVLEVVRSRVPSNIHNRHLFAETCGTSVANLADITNAHLSRLTLLAPRHHLLWCFRSEPSLAVCAQYNFRLSFLLLFLENLVFYWADHCPAAQISFSLEADSACLSPGEGDGGTLRMGWLSACYQPLLEEPHWEDSSLLDNRRLAAAGRETFSTASSRQSARLPDQQVASQAQHLPPTSANSNNSSAKKKGRNKKSKKTTESGLAYCQHVQALSAPMERSRTLVRILQDLAMEGEALVGARRHFPLPSSLAVQEGVFQLRLPCLFSLGEEAKRRSAALRAKLQEDRQGDWRREDLPTDRMTEEGGTNKKAADLSDDDDADLACATASSWTPIARRTTRDARDAKEVREALPVHRPTAAVGTVKRVRSRLDRFWQQLSPCTASVVPWEESLP